MPLDGQTFVLPDLDFDERVRRSLRKAAAHVERGWCQNAYSKDGRVCAFGAIIEAELYDVAARVAMGKRLASVLGLTFERIEMWNDTPGRTQAEVVAALRRAAEL